MKLVDIKGPHNSTYPNFLALADLELKRAERYRIFVSLIVLDLSFLRERFGSTADDLLAQIAEAAGQKIRCTDTATIVDQQRLALLFPETPRQNAMVAARRLTELVRRTLSERSGQNIEETIPVEMASYPDAAGAKSVGTFLSELAQRSRN